MFEGARGGLILWAHRMCGGQWKKMGLEMQSLDFWGHAKELLYRQ